MAKKRESISLWVVASRDALGLGERAQAVVVPGEGDRVGQVLSGGGLFDEGGAVPGEVDLFGDGFAVGGEALLGGAAAQRVVEVAPAGAVGGGDGGEAVFGVPCVAPGVGLLRQAGLLAQGDAARGVVFVADACPRGVMRVPV